jgi:two-component system sensor histidine kinase ChvG
MTRALYERIDAIESFAADVAHELKNPLTSLKSAVEMFERTKDPDNRERLVQVIRNDVKRIDRLITDISDARGSMPSCRAGHSEPINLAKLLDTIVDIYTGMDVPRGVPHPLCGKFRQIGFRPRHRHALGTGFPQPDRQRDFLQPRTDPCWSRPKR